MDLRRSDRSGSQPLRGLGRVWGPLLAGLVVASLAAAARQDLPGGSASQDPESPGPAPAEPRELPSEPRVPTPLDLGGENTADYEIHASLEEAPDGSQSLTGALTLRWTNRSGEAAPDLWFHLYWNAFANNLSTHLFESRGRLRDDEPVGDDDWGWMRVTALRLVDEAGGEPVDLLPSLRYEAPDDGRPEDRTVFAVDLPAPVPSGQSAVVEIEWESRVPGLRRRTGHKGDFVFAAHWFPKLGVFEAGRGWQCHQFHRTTEFYSDYGSYSVTLDLPASYQGRVAGTGLKTLENKVGGGRMEVRFEAPAPPGRDEPRVDHLGTEPRVHAFTWTADTNFEAVDYTFVWNDWAEQYPEAVEEARRAFGPDVELGGSDVAVRVMIQAERREQADRHFHATSAALFFYGLWYGPYPYPNITVVDPAWGGRAAGGMEYPTLFTAGTRLFTRPEMQSPEGVTVHEAGHQFWYGLVGNNEAQAAWLDEGFNSYTDAEVMMRVWGPRHGATDYASYPLAGQHVADWPGTAGVQGAFTLSRFSLDWLRDELGLHPVRRADRFLDWWLEQPLLTLAPYRSDARWEDRSGYLRDPDSDRVDTPAWQYVDSQGYRTNSYPRTAVALRTLAGLLGRETFLAGLRKHSETWRYRHPYGEDFYRAFLEGAELDEEQYLPLFHELFKGTATVDWSVAVVQQPAPEPRGWFDDERGVFQAPPEEPDPSEPAEEPLPDTGEEQAPLEPQSETLVIWHTDITVRRSGELRLPLPIFIEFDDGERLRPVWTRADQAPGQWRRVEHESPYIAHIDHGASGSWIRIRCEGPQKVAQVVLDPPEAGFGAGPEHPLGRRYYMDADMSDNEWHAESDSVTPLRWAERVFTQYAHFLHRLGGIGG